MLTQKIVLATPKQVHAVVLKRGRENCHTEAPKGRAKRSKTRPGEAGPAEATPTHIHAVDLDWGRQNGNKAQAWDSPKGDPRREKPTWASREAGQTTNYIKQNGLFHREFKERSRESCPRQPWRTCCQMHWYVVSGLFGPVHLYTLKVR